MNEIPLPFPADASQTDPVSPTLPNDLSLAHQLILQQQEALAARDKEIAKLLHQLEQLRRRLFGSKTERVDLPTEPVPEAPAPAAPAAKKKGHGRRPLPKDLPRHRIEYLLPPEACTCGKCGQELTKIGEETAEQLEYVPASFLVIEHARAKYACQHCASSVVTAPKPAQPIEKGLPGPGLLAHVMVSKYADHLPLYRQAQMFFRHGIVLDEATLGDWVRQCSELLLVLYLALKTDLLRSKVIHTDDTPVPVQERGRKKTKSGRLWVAVGDREHPHVVFDYTPTRERDGPLKFFEEFAGYLQADAYGGYDQLFAKRKEIVEVACWAHARRYFFEAQKTDSARALYALAVIKELYKIERDAQAWAEEQQLDFAAAQAYLVAQRQARTRPLLDDFATWLAAQVKQVLPKSPMGEAVTYARNQWQALVRFLDDADLDPDNNAAERALRCVAIGRKNWLFAGSDQGGLRAAVLYTLVASCKHAGVEPFAYLRDVLRRLPEHSIQRLDELFPCNWKTSLESLTPSATA